MQKRTNKSTITTTSTSPGEKTAIPRKIRLRLYYTDLIIDQTSKFGLSLISISFLLKNIPQIHFDQYIKSELFSNFAILLLGDVWRDCLSDGRYLACSIEPHFVWRVSSSCKHQKSEQVCGYAGYEIAFQQPQESGSVSVIEMDLCTIEVLACVPLTPACSWTHTCSWSYCHLEELWGGKASGLLQKSDAV